MPTLKAKYASEVAPALMKQFGYKRVMQIPKIDKVVVNVGYRVAKEGKNLVMNLGFSHQVIVSEIEGITIEVPAPNKIIIRGCDKEAVGQFAAEVREKRPPEPYKGKGIKYTRGCAPRSPALPRCRA